MLLTKEPLKSESGFSVIGVIIAAGVMGTIVFFLMDQILTANRAQLGLEKRMEISGIKQRLFLEIDCANTLAGVNPATDCTPTNFLPLKDKLNNIIGSTPGTGVLMNSRALEGRWYVRATCAAAPPNQSLEVRIAMQGSTPGIFGKDPVNNSDYDWAYVKGIVFGPSGTTICHSQLGGGGAPASPTAWKSGDLVAGGGCQSNYVWGDDGNDESRTLYSGTVLCDPGKAAVAGSVDCGVGGTTRLQHSHVTPAGDGWSGACCPDSAISGVGRIKVLCQ